MNEPALDRILEKLRSGALPREMPDCIWGGPATGQTCAACEVRISEKLEIEAEGVDGVYRFFHAKCFALLSLERDRIGTCSGDRGVREIQA